MSRTLALALAALLLLPAAASAHGRPPLPPTARMAQAGRLMECPGEPMRVDRSYTGSFAHEQMGSYVLVPFDVPAARRPCA